MKAEESIHKKELETIKNEDRDNLEEEINSLEGTFELSTRSELDPNNNLAVDVGDSDNSAEILEEDPFPDKRPVQRKYKIQEVIKVRQILLVQVTKEERGNKGAALTTYLSMLKILRFYA